VDKATGYGAVVPLSAKSAMLLEKEQMKNIYHKILDGVLLAVEKHKDKAKPVDYKKYPLKAEGRESRLEHVEKKDTVAVEIYGWSKLII
jgi:hypothetical protein